VSSLKLHTPFHLISAKEIKKDFSMYMLMPIWVEHVAFYCVFFVQVIIVFVQVIIVFVQDIIVFVQGILSMSSF